MMEISSNTRQISLVSLNRSDFAVMRSSLPWGLARSSITGKHIENRIFVQTLALYLPIDR